MDNESCSRARLARDARFDGLFFTAVKTTGIFCRPICPAAAPKERNVAYFPSALAASQAGYRPCLRCRPEAAPGSPAWCGTGTTLSRAVRLIDEGSWQGQPLAEFAERLGVSDRYLRRLFSEGLGMSPLRYLNFRRVMLVKQLLQQSVLPIGDIALAAGFGSVRRCNAAFQQLMGMAPGAVRRAIREPKVESDGKSEVEPKGNGISLFISYRPPYDWQWLQQFLARRVIPGVESVTDSSYRRTIRIEDARGAFAVEHCPERYGFRIQLWLDQPQYTAAAIAGIRRVLDLDADRRAIGKQLCSCPAMAAGYAEGLPQPGIWSPFEAGVRAILGQQISVSAARRLVTILVTELGELIDSDQRLFPEPSAVAASELKFLPMPGSRRGTLRRFADYLATGGSEDPQQWLALKGIGRWTVDYARLRLGDPDVWLEGDLGVRKGLALLQSGLQGELQGESQPADWRPWRSYASLQLWHLLEKKELEEKGHD